VLDKIPTLLVLGSGARRSLSPSGQPSKTRCKVAGRRRSIPDTVCTGKTSRATSGSWAIGYGNHAPEPDVPCRAAPDTRLLSSQVRGGAVGFEAFRTVSLAELHAEPVATSGEANSRNTSWAGSAPGTETSSKDPPTGDERASARESRERATSVLAAINGPVRIPAPDTLR
jgi:hypothetical protein